MNCAICNKPITGREAHLEIESSGNLYHTCNMNEKGNTCYQEWLMRPKQESKNVVNDLSQMPL